jgi:hypothetical protein
VIVGSNLLKEIRARIPSRQQVLPVFSIFVFFGFSWALYRLFWYIPSWLEYLSVWKVLTIAAYVLAFALVESIIIFGLLLLFSLLFPPSIFKEKFIAIGSSLAALISIGAVLLQRKINLVYRLEILQVVIYPFAFVLILVAAVFILSLVYKRSSILARFIEAIADRMVIFAYFYIPVSLLGLLVVVVRNLIGF